MTFRVLGIASPGVFNIALYLQKFYCESIIADNYSSNPDMTSRIPFTLDFPDYSQDELREIAILLLAQKGYQIEDAALELVLDICNYERSGDDYANARTLQNILDQVLLNQNLRTEHSAGDNCIIRTDVEE